MEFDFKIKNRDIETLLDTIKTNRPDANLELIKKAYRFAEKCHLGQKRLSGEPYIIHPLEVGLILADLKMDTDTIASALLHDVVEDTNMTLATIEAEFGKEVAYMVNGVTKISSLKNKTKTHEEAQTLRKMLLATINDTRVIIIKLADKTHNMRTIMFQPPFKQARMAREVIDIYAPLASRLGIQKIATELEDLAFHVMNPIEYNEIKSRIATHKKEMEEYISRITVIIEDKMKDQHVKAKIFGRIKHFYSIHRKMISQNKTLDQIYDVRAIRIITDEVKDCYAILGIIHSLWSPVPARFKDYIAVPKTNGYQSLHTTVTGPEGHFLEVQIRTKDMDLTAEIGIAAHWAYKESGKNKNISLKQAELSLLQDIERCREELQNAREFMTELKLDLYQEEVFVFTPRGKIIKLPNGSTPIDFAYAIHTDIGTHCSGSKVNNKIVPLKTKLRNGDIVEIITNPNRWPSETWLKYTRSTRARIKIRSYINKQHHLGKEVDPAKTRDAKAQAAHTEKSSNIKIKPADLTKFGKEKRNSLGIIVDGNSDVMIRIAQCCQPIPGDEVIGFITRGKGISVHKKSCPSLVRYNIEGERLINIIWTESTKNHPVKITIKAFDRPLLIKDIADELSTIKVNISRMDAMAPKGGVAEVKLILDVRDVTQMNEIILKLKKITGVREVFKVNEKVIRK